MSSRGDCPSPENRRRKNCASGSRSRRRRKRSSLTSSSAEYAPPVRRAAEGCCNSNSDCNGGGSDSEGENCEDEDSEPCDNYYRDIFLWGFIVLLILTVLMALWGGGRWSGKGADANLALASMGACITTNAQGLSCTSKQKVDDPSIIISGQPVIPGSAFCFEGQSADFMLTLSPPAYVTGFTYEHVSKDAHPEKHIESAPKMLLINGIETDSNGQLAEIFLGNFEYLDDGNPMQSFYFKNPNLSVKFPEVKVSVLGNHGHHFTCVYRIQVHGKIRSDQRQPKSDSHGEKIQIDSSASAAKS